eukprot:3638019-Prymnesium_polylepis.2
MPSGMLRERATQAAERVVALALESSFNGDLMNQATTYVLDQHRLARRLHMAPAEARALLPVSYTHLTLPTICSV